MKKEDAYKLGVGQTQFRRNFKRKKRIRKAWQFVVWSLLLLILFAGLFCTCIHISQCHDAGMSGAISQGDIVITNRLAYLLKDPVRGEIVTCKIKDNAGVEMICQRRIIAFPGEHVQINNGSISVDGRLCIENYVSGATTSEMATVIVPPGSYYVLCDDRSIGPDSRDGFYLNPVSIKGAVIQNFPIISAAEFFNSAYDRLLEYIN